MSVFAKICTGLMISALGLTAYAANPGSPEKGPDQVPVETELNVADTREVIQVLYVSNVAEIKLAELVRQKNPDASLQRYADELTADHAWMNRNLETLASLKGISLKTGEMDESAQLVGNKMDQELQTLASVPEPSFRSAFLEAAIIEHQKTLELFDRILQGNSDEALRSSIAVSRPLIEKHLKDAQRLKNEIQQPGSEIETPID
jgi:predicted outer membrane protein